MKFTLTAEVLHPRDEVFAVQRDTLPDLVRFLPNVERIEREILEQGGDILRVRNDWYGSVDEIPALVRPLVKPEWLQWSDEAVWDADRFVCEWQTHLNMFPGAITSRGTTRFEDEGDATLVTVHGEFSIDPARIRGIPTGLARKVAPRIEKFVIGVLEPNMKRTLQAVEEYIDDQY